MGLGVIGQCTNTSFIWRGPPAALAKYCSESLWIRTSKTHWQQNISHIFLVALFKDCSKLGFKSQSRSVHVEICKVLNKQWAGCWESSIWFFILFSSLSSCTAALRWESFQNFSFKRPKLDLIWIEFIVCNGHTNENLFTKNLDFYAYSGSDEISNMYHWTPVYKWAYDFKPHSGSDLIFGARGHNWSECG